MGFWSRGERQGSTGKTRTREEPQPRSREEAADGQMLRGSLGAEGSYWRRVREVRCHPWGCGRPLAVEGGECSLSCLSRILAKSG